MMIPTTLLIVTLMTLSMACHGQNFSDRLTHRLQIEAGCPLPDSEGLYKKLTLETHYKILPRLSAGLGVGIGHIDEVLVPVYAGIRWTATRERRVSPFVEGRYGYSFAPSAHVNGGSTMGLAVGVDWLMARRHHIILALGYDYQGYERLQSYDSQYLRAEYLEQLSHNSICLKIGYRF